MAAPRSLGKLIGAKLSEVLPPSFSETAKLRVFGFLKIPLLFFVSPRVLELNDERCVVKIPLTRRTKNHLGSMYFGVLATGADASGGLIAWRRNDELGSPLALIFKEFKAEFLKRAEGDVHFTCTQGKEIARFVDDCIASGERKNFPVEITATVPSKLGDEPVAKFVLLLSMKVSTKTKKKV
jgi:acyl-coenzyme A thioesterase PaaI-like protein